MDTLDKHNAAQREEMLAQLTGIKQTVETAHQQALASQKESYETQLTAVTGQLTELESVHELQKQLLTTTGGVKDNLIDAFALKQKQLRRSNELQRLFRKWVDFWKHAKRQDALTDKWVQPLLARRSLTRIFSAWRTAAVVKQKRTEEQFWKDQTRAISKRIINSYEQELHTLRQELATAKLEKKHTQEDGAVLEEQMKQAFMRGVCALNREAMAVFSQQNSDHSDSGNSNNNKENDPLTTQDPNGKSGIGPALGKPLYTPEELANAMSACLHTYRSYGEGNVHNTEIDNDRS
jgi:centrosomal protein POC5